LEDEELFEVILPILDKELANKKFLTSHFGAIDIQYFMELQQVHLLKPLDSFKSIHTYMLSIRQTFKNARPNGEQIIEELDQKFMMAYRKNYANKK
jgi:hypothetical protein